jgi:hypothetical protein
MVYFIIENFEKFLQWDRRRWDRRGTRELIFCIYYCFAGYYDHDSTRSCWCLIQLTRGTILVTVKLAKGNVKQNKKPSSEQPLHNRRRLKSNSNCGSGRNLAPCVLLHLPLPRGICHHTLSSAVLYRCSLFHPFRYNFSNLLFVCLFKHYDMRHVCTCNGACLTHD